MASFKKTLKYNAIVSVDTEKVSCAALIYSDAGHLKPAILTLTEILQLTEFLEEIKPVIVAEIVRHDRNMQEHDESNE